MAMVRRTSKPGRVERHLHCDKAAWSRAAKAREPTPSRMDKNAEEERATTGGAHTQACLVCFSQSSA